MGMDRMIYATGDCQGSICGQNASILNILIPAEAAKAACIAYKEAIYGLLYSCLVGTGCMC